MTITIPHPENPQHVENLCSIALLETQGFRGTDASLSESLFQYGLAWRDLGDEYLIVYRHPSLVNHFDRCTLAKDTDVRHEWNWVEWADMADFTGQSEAELGNPQNLLDTIFSLVLYYGTEEIFGTSYREGFEISDE